MAALTTTFFLLLALFVPPSAADFVIYSNPPESLIPGQNLTYDMTTHGIPFGPFQLILQKDCNLVRFELGKRTWSSNTALEEDLDCYLTLLPNGEIILRNNFHYPLWRSNNYSAVGNYAFVLAWDGTLAVFGPDMWSTEEVAASDPYPMTSTTDYVINSYQVTPSTFGLLLSYKNFRLVLRRDCNLVLEDLNTFKIMWQTNTNGSKYTDCFTYFDENGELFVKANRRDVLWRSNKRLPQPALFPQTPALVLRYDGQLVVYGPQIWRIPGNSAVSATRPRGSYAHVGRLTSS